MVVETRSVYHVCSQKNVAAELKHEAQKSAMKRQRLKALLCREKSSHADERRVESDFPG
jgi:hypothetical protein